MPGRSDRTQPVASSELVSRRSMSHTPSNHAFSSRRLASAHDSRPRAVVYCEANFGAPDGKTANGLVRHSERYEILSVIDSQQAGRDSGEILDDEVNGIPVVANLAAAI